MSSALAPQNRVRHCGPYVLGRRIGSGGMAAVFAARQSMPSGVGRLVAVKLMSAVLSDDREFRALFVREASIATRLEHPNIVRIYDVGEASGDLYIAMEFVYGASLGALQSAAADAPMPPAIAARIIGDVARALHAAHELKDPITGELLGLVHQDVSPQNVMVGYDGAVKLLDFGVARIGAQDASRTETLRGKPSYLAPEQLEGGRIDRRTDLFSLGVALFELLTGTRLFRRGSIAESHHAILACKVPDVRELRPDVPESIARVAAKALSRNMDERFASALDFRRALNEACASASLREADEAEVGAYAARLVPNEVSPADLEREIVEGTDAHAVVAKEAAVVALDVADMPTMAPKRSIRPIKADSEPAPKPSINDDKSKAPSSRARAVAIAAIVLAGGVFFAVRSRAPLPPMPNARESALPIDAPADPSATTTPIATAPDNAPSNAPSARAPNLESTSPLHHIAATPRVTPSSAPIATATAVATSDPAPAVAADPNPGTLSVRCTPWAHVWIDGKKVGDSPTVVPLKPGTHTVTVRTDDGKEQSTTVTIEADKKSKVNLTL